MATLRTETMNRRQALACAAAALACATAARAADDADESALRSQVAQSLWPADIVRAADRYLRAFPQGAAAATVANDRDRAARSAAVLVRRELRLFRSAFEPPAGDAAARDELRRAALGDAAAAVRLAQTQRGGAGGEQRYVGWLQLASGLGDAPASYELALHFRRTDQPILADQYEARALELGFKPAPALDHSRK